MKIQPRCGQTLLTNDQALEKSRVFLAGLRGGAVVRQVGTTRSEAVGMKLLSDQRLVFLTNGYVININDTQVPYELLPDAYLVTGTE